MSDRKTLTMEELLSLEGSSPMFEVNKIRGPAALAPYRKILAEIEARAGDMSEDQIEDAIRAALSERKRARERPSEVAPMPTLPPRPND